LDPNNQIKIKKNTNNNTSKKSANKLFVGIVQLCEEDHVLDQGCIGDCIGDSVANRLPLQCCHKNLTALINLHFKEQLSRGFRDLSGFYLDKTTEVFVCLLALRRACN
jgi:hypothetical protein